jgi:hypothetical protein
MSNLPACSTTTGSLLASPRYRAASDYGRMGWPVFPVSPHFRVQASEASTSLLQIGRWWRDTPDADIAIQTGWKSGLWALKAKGRAGLEAMARLEGEYAPLPRTTTTVTEDGGSDYLFAWPSDRMIPSTDELPGLPFAVCGDGGYLVVPPSTRVAGPGLHWSLSPNHKDPALAPSWLLDLVTNKPDLAQARKPETLTKPELESARSGKPAPAPLENQPQAIPETISLKMHRKVKAKPVSGNIDDILDEVNRTYVPRTRRNRGMHIWAIR